MNRLSIISKVVGTMALVALTAAAQMPMKGVRAEIIGQLQDAEKKVIALAETMPQEKYGWRPMEGVRSVSEVYMHIAIANYGLPGMMGKTPKEKIDRSMGTSVTKKAEVMEWLKKSFEYVKDCVANTPDEDLDKATKIFGNDGTYRGVMVLIATHAHEHLGQSIAYARMNKVVPPWSMGSGM